MRAVTPLKTTGHSCRCVHAPMQLSRRASVVKRPFGRVDRASVERNRSSLSFGSRLWVRLRDPSVLTLPVVVPVFWVARRLDLIASTPLWLVFVLLVAGSVCTSIAAALWAEVARGWQLWARVAVHICSIT